MRRLRVVSCEPKRAPNAVEDSRRGAGTWPRLTRRPMPQKPRPWMSFGSMGEMTAGPCRASIAAGAIPEEPVHDTSHQADRNSFRSHYPNPIGPIRVAGRSTRSTAQGPGSPATSGSPATRTPNRRDRLPGPASLSVPAASPFVTGDLRRAPSSVPRGLAGRIRNTERLVIAVQSPVVYRTHFE